MAEEFPVLWTLEVPQKEKLGLLMTGSGGGETGK